MSTLLYQGRWIPLGRLNLLTSAKRRPRCWTIRKGRSRTNTVKLGRAGRSGHFLMQWMLCWVTGHRSTYCSDWYTRRSQLQQGKNDDRAFQQEEVSQQLSGESSVMGASGEISSYDSQTPVPASDTTIAEDHNDICPTVLPTVEKRRMKNETERNVLKKQWLRLLITLWRHKRQVMASLPC